MLGAFYEQEELVKRNTSNILTVQLIETIGQDKPVDQTALGIAMGLSRIQVNRILRNLETAGVIAKSGGSSHGGYCYRVDEDAKHRHDCYIDLAAVGIFN